MSETCDERLERIMRDKARVERELGETARTCTKLRAELEAAKRKLETAARLIPRDDKGEPVSQSALFALLHQRDAAWKELEAAKKGSAINYADALRFLLVIRRLCSWLKEAHERADREAKAAREAREQERRTLFVLELERKARQDSENRLKSEARK